METEYKTAVYGIHASLEYYGKVQMIGDSKPKWYLDNNTDHVFKNNDIYEIMGYTECKTPCSITKCCGRVMFSEVPGNSYCLAYGPFRCYKIIEPKRIGRFIRLEI